MAARGIAVHVGRFQIIGLVGVALFAIGAVLGVVLPQLSPPIMVPLELSWGLFLVGGVLFWLGVIGGIIEVVRGAARGPSAPGPGTAPRLR